MQARGHRAPHLSASIDGRTVDARILERGLQRPDARPAGALGVLFADCHRLQFRRRRQNERPPVSHLPTRHLYMEKKAIAVIHTLQLLSYKGYSTLLLTGPL